MSKHMRASDYYRAGNVKRWQIVQTVREQNLAEHSFQVAMIAWTLYDKLMCSCQGNDSPCDVIFDRDLLFRWSLMHDMPEVLTGDVAANLKNHIISQCDHDPFEVVEDLLSPKHKAVREEVKENPIIRHIVKMADIIEAYKFLKVNAHTGHGEEIMDTLFQKILKKAEVLEGEYPTMKWSKNVKAVVLELTGPETHLTDII